MTDAALRDQYRDLVELDRSAEGIRYAAALPDGTPVTVRAITNGLGARIQHPERFFATLERAAAIHHDALARPLAWGRAGGTIHVAYRRTAAGEIVPGSLSPSGVAAIGVRLSRALVAVHSTGLIHGAITRSRIARASEDAVWMGEFGLFAALVAGGVDVREAAAALCEAPYVSPEAKKGELPDERSDIYSLGAVLYELLTGKPPYGGRTTSYVLASILSDAADPDASAEATSPIVDALIRAIEREPDDRWPNAAAFASALEAGAVAGKSAGRVSRKRGCVPTAAGAAVIGIAAITAVVSALARR